MRSFIGAFVFSIFSVSAFGEAVPQLTLNPPKFCSTHCGWWQVNEPSLCGAPHKTQERTCETHCDGGQSWTTFQRECIPDGDFNPESFNGPYGAFVGSSQSAPISWDKECSGQWWATVNTTFEMTPGGYVDSYVWTDCQNK